MNLLLKSLPLLLPVATAWVDREERKILRNGIPLTMRSGFIARWNGKSCFTPQNAIQRV